MTFLFPSFLFALGVLIIPILIHLFNFKRFKKVYFSNVSFLKDIKLESEKKSKLKHLLVLISRILGLTALVFAFSQPIILNNDAAKIKQNISIYIDNSFSMDAKNENGQLFEQAKESAIELIESYGNSYEYKLITNDLLGKHTHVLSKNEMLSEISNTTLSATSPDFQKITKRINLSENDSYLISDFQKSTFKFNERDSLNKQQTLIPIQSDKNQNLYIDSIWFSTPNRTGKANETIFARVRNQSDKNLNFKLKLNINKDDVAFSEENIDKNSTLDIKLNFNSSNQKSIRGIINLSDYENPEISFDDDFYFSYTINTNTRISIIHDDEKISKNLARLYRLDSTSILNIMDNHQVDYNVINDSELIILNQLNTISSGLANQLSELLNQGKSIVVIPSESISTESYNAFFSMLNINQFSTTNTSLNKLKSIDKNHPFFHDIFLSTDKKMDLPSFQLSYSNKYFSNIKEENIIQFSNGSDFLTKIDIKSGTLYKFCSPLFLEKSTFSNHALFVPIMLRIKELSKQSISPYFVIGEENKILASLIERVPNSESETYVIKKDANQFIPRIIKENFIKYISISDEIKTAGIADIIDNIDNNNISPIAFNYNRNESDSKTYTIKELNEFGFTVLDSNNPKLAIEQHIKELKGKSLWIYFIFAALLFFLIEILLIRFLK